MATEAKAAAKDINEAKARLIAAQQTRFAKTFAQIVAVMMRDARHRNVPLRELESILAPIMAGQAVVASMKSSETGPIVPVAAAIWARVSPAVDKRLSENLDKAVQLRANDWSSGDTVWLMVLAGAPRGLKSFVEKLCEKEFKGRTVKMRVTDKSGKTSVNVIQEAKVA